jgi:signal transduction histidine kinase/FixJ family two-component response regulator/putative methionine-R-sulfoxide reductase with GAF domain
MNKPTEKIIVVDDEKGYCDSLCALLGDEGYQVESYQRSKKAVEAIRGAKVDLVLTDIRMPEISGLEILRIVKETDEEIPVVLMTGYASLGSAVEAVSLGAYDYLMKPVEFEQLLRLVKRALEKRRGDLARRQLLEELKISNMILNRRINELNALYEAGKSIGSTLHLKDLLRQIVALASNVTEAQIGSIMLINEAGTHMTIEAAIGLEKEIVALTCLPIGSSIAGSVAQTGEPLMIDDVENDERFQRINKERYGSASLLCVPLTIKNKVIGVINMANKQDKEGFTKNDLKLLTTFASQAAVAVDDANQFEKNRRRLIEFEILNEISGALPSIQSMNDFRKLLINQLTRLFPVDYSMWFRWDAEIRTLIPDGVSGETDIPLTDSGSIDLRRINRDLITLPSLPIDSSHLEDIPALSKLLAGELAKKEYFPTPKAAYMAIPIKRHGELTYVFYLGNNSEHPYSADDVSLAKLVISQAAILFERERALLNATRLLTMGNMISEISHDLRKPLTSIKGGLQIIRQRWPELTESSEFFKSVHDEIQRMNDLVRELVDFSNPNKYQTEKTDLKRLVARAAELVGPDMRKKGIEFESEFEDADWDVIVNKNQILETLLNLFINAIDAMPAGGKLTVRGLIESPKHKKTDYLALKIADTGCGIKKENISRIFDRYYTTKEAGTGLGLSVVERIISAHNGTVAVESVEGQGAVFTIYLPCKQ